MGEIRDEDLQTVVLDPAIEWLNVRRGGSFRHVLVVDLIAAAEARIGSRPSLEAETDDFVERIGGRKEGVIDPWRFMANVARRLRGRKPHPPDDIYEIPEDFFAGPAGQDN